ncbi:MAG: methionine aminotransferase [Desulfobacteraceae bacterium]|jgi:methionine aminotransferase|nr:methionine aminotransferase [Desulfobacteraceae bacterium]
MTIMSKLPDVGTNIFTVMSAMAAEHGAVNLSQGFPDFDTPPALIDRVLAHMRAGRNQYAPMQGVALLRERIAAKVADLYGNPVDSDREITVTSGATEALFAAITAVVRPGDEVVVFEPAFDAYVPAIRLNGGTPVYLSMKTPDYRIDWDEVSDAIGDDTRLVILNSPHNPTGTVLSPADITALRRIVAQRDIFIVSDEVYEHIIFDGLAHESVLKDPQLYAKSFVVSSFGKTYHPTGWKIGYCVAPPPLTREFQRVHQFLTFASNTPIQYAYADILADASLYLELSAFYQQKRDRFLSLLADSRFKPLPCHGTYFQMMDYSAVSNLDDVAFARQMTTVHKVAAIPPSTFYHDGQDNRVLRFCFAKRDQTLEQAAQILCRI